MSENAHGKTVADVISEVTEQVPSYKAAVTETGQNLLLVSKAVTVALSPLKAIVWGYEKIEKYLTNRLAEKLKDIPQEKIVTPDPKLVGPALEGMKYTAQEDFLREMYATLISNAMNADKKDDLHPAYVDIIKNISSEEALILKIFISTPIIPIINVKQKLPAGGFITLLPLFSDIGLRLGFEDGHFDSVPKNINNLVRLGILEIPATLRMRDEKHYENLKKICDKSMEGRTDIEYEPRLLQLTPFGKDFISTVVL